MRQDDLVKSSYHIRIHPFKHIGIIPSNSQHLFNASNLSLTQPNSNSSQRPVHEPSVGIQNVLVELTQRRVEVRAVSKLHRVPVDLVRTGLGPEATECVIIAGTTCGVETNARASDVGTAADSLHGGYGLCGDVLDVGVVGGGDVLLVHSVACYTSPAVVSAVEEVHGCGGGLGVIIAPGVEDVSGCGVDVHEPANL